MWSWLRSQGSTGGRGGIHLRDLNKRQRSQLQINSSFHQSGKGLKQHGKIVCVQKLLPINGSEIKWNRELAIHTLFLIQPQRQRSDHPAVPSTTLLCWACPRVIPLVPKSTGRRLEEVLVVMTCSNKHNKQVGKHSRGCVSFFVSVTHLESWVLQDATWMPGYEPNLATWRPCAKCLCAKTYDWTNHSWPGQFHRHLETNRRIYSLAPK